MANRREIQFDIDENGEVSIKVIGLKGPDCERLTREIEEALGVVKTRQHTSEYYQQTEQTEKVGQGES
jgi:hypothetical protein